ncbi:serine hydroxymethyltransferase [Collinsella sp. An307]|uniref:serine hydroxymethyltransferase n=1 Tax=Collinsella sp. An307 TaxID=1965630 RepID=UPI000B399D4B|nr:serine hydroxymethyltransferase [Collinsella sp. An307]OUO20862.1 serine hydroxymethyltransferase [Collinsella sp. An307]
MALEHLAQTDPELAAALDAELARQRNTIELIASENFVSPSVLEAVGSVLTNKYAEGYPGRRYYGGCECVDVVEDLARSRACALFGCGFANVQPHSGANANLAAYTALLEPGDTVIGMRLDQGGHLTHGSPVNFSGKLYRFLSYGLDPATETIDYDGLEALAAAERPKLIVGGASAYPRSIDFERLAAIAHGVGARLMVDMAHIAGLVATGAHPSPFPHADVVTTTTHKTLRGPRGGLILTNDAELARAIDKAVFPGMQGGPLMHVIAGKAACFAEAATPAFADYIARMVKGAAALGEGLVAGGLRLVSGGTDNHLCLVDLTSSGVNGHDAELLLEACGLTVNKNAIPNDPLPPAKTSGIRVGSAAGTTRVFTAAEFREIGELVARAVFGAGDAGVRAVVRARVDELLAAHPLYPEM